MRRIEAGDDDWYDNEVIEFFEDGTEWQYICYWQAKHRCWRGLECKSPNNGWSDGNDEIPYMANSFIGYWYISHGVKCDD